MIASLPHGLVQFAEFGCVVEFLDGAQVLAAPPVGGLELAHYHVISHRLGYQDDLLRYCQEHELAHMVAEQWLHNRPSQVLWGLAHKAPLSPGQSAYEEMMAQALQRFARAAERPIIGGVDWDGMLNLFLLKLGEFQ